MISRTNPRTAEICSMKTLQKLGAIRKQHCLKDPLKSHAGILLHALKCTCSTEALHGSSARIALRGRKKTYIPFNPVALKM